MTSYELSNDQRKYFGLALVADNWERQSLNDLITIYFNGDKIVKILDYSYGYFEYDTDIDTKDRKIILPKTSRGKEQKLTIPRILKIKGSGILFAASLRAGGISVYDNRRNLFFIKSFIEEGKIETYQDLNTWISNYIATTPKDYFEWLNQELSQKREKIKAQEGDIIAFKISRNEYGFARILLDVFTDRKKGDIIRPELYWVHPRSLIVAPYAYYADTLKIDIDTLVSKKTLPARCIFDLDVYRGEMPIIGHKPLSEKDKQIPFPNDSVTSVTIHYTKADIEKFIATNGM
jgi:hypothetical protein